VDHLRTTRFKIFCVNIAGILCNWRILDLEAQNSSHRAADISPRSCFRVTANYRPDAIKNAKNPHEKNLGW
jgi:hypothetical protein